jgi:2-polyprenyl-3-methyl-5-hydroxy-6-metoxy-1,4-benzoquinol methylase
MSNEQAERIADLRYPLESRDPGGERWSQWSSAPMIELSARDTYHFVKTMLPSARCRILEVGCGNGYLTLELARDGHEVIGIDLSPDILQVAERSRVAHAEPPGFGRLSYVCADIATWQAPQEPFDVVIFNRALHHLHELQPALMKIQRLLCREGRLICQDYAYDRLNKQTASWLYAMQRLLFVSGLAAEDPATMADESASIEALQRAWFQKAEQREHRLHRYDEMIQALQTVFQPQFASWVPYLFVYIANGLLPRSLPERMRALIPFLKEMEAYLIETGAIQALGFRWVGTSRV